MSCRRLGAVAVQRDEPLRQRLRALRLAIDDHQPAGAQPQRRFGHRRAGPARAQLHHAAHGRLRQRAPEGPRPARAVGVVADQAAAAVDDGVHRAHRLGLLGQLVEQRHHGLLAGVGDVQPVEPHGAGGRDQRGQLLDARAGGVEVDQLVVQPKAVVGGLLLVQPRRQGALDARADEADEQLLHGRAVLCCHLRTLAISA